MARMSDIDLTIQYIKNWFKEHIAYIVAILFVLVMTICVYGQADRDIKRAVEKENRIDNTERTLQEQMNYIHELKADVDNLYRVVE